MAETPSTQAERRCANCGALLYDGAAWCGMCFEPVAPERDPDAREPASDPEPAPTPAARATERRADPAPEAPITEAPPSEAPITEATVQAGWPCPICDSRNPVELDFCATCGASFASLMRQETTLIKVDPRAAFRRSLLFPGLGHRMIPGREVDGFARAVLFAMLLIATLMLGLSGVRAGAVLFLFLVYLASTVSVYLLTALEAARLADGGDPVISSRTLLWATVAILIMSIVVVAFVIGAATRR
jgi:hypothetical protein